MAEVGALCVKIAGRDANKKCVIVEVLDGNFVMIDGETRRKKCNIIHLEPLGQKLRLKSKASHADVVKAFKDELKIEIKEKKKKEKAAERPKKVRKAKEKKEKPAKEKLSKKVEKEDKKTAKKAEKKDAKEAKEEKPKDKKSEAKN